MKSSIIILLFLCAYAVGAPNIFENSRLNSDAKDKQIDISNSQKPPSLFRRENVSDSKRKRCENCRNLKRCKVHKMCDMCNIACKDVDISQLETPEVDVLENNQDDLIMDSAQATDVVLQSDGSRSNSDRFYTLENNEPEPKRNIMSRISKKNALNNPKEVTKPPVIMETPQSDADVIHFIDDDTQTESTSLPKNEEKVHTNVEEKKRLLNESKLTKDELSKMVGHVKALQNRRSNREGLLHLRSRSVLNKADQSTEAKQAVDSREKPTLGKLFINRGLHKGRYGSAGLRKLNDNPSSGEKAENKENVQEQPEEVKIPIIDLPSSTINHVEEPSTAKALHHSPKNDVDNVLQLRQNKQDDINNKENLLTPEKFSMILRSLEEKVENIADLVRKTCRYPITTNSDLPETTESSKLPIKKLRESQVQEKLKDDNQLQKGQSDPQNKVIDLTNSDEEEEEKLPKPFNNNLKEPPTIASKSGFTNNDLRPESVLENDRTTPVGSNHKDVSSKSDGINEEEPTSKNLLETETTQPNFVSPKVFSDEIEEDNTNQQNPTSRNSENEDTMKNKHNGFGSKAIDLNRPIHESNNRLLNKGFKSAEEGILNDDILPFNKHHYNMQEPHHPIRLNHHKYLPDLISPVKHNRDDVVPNNKEENTESHLRNSDPNGLRDDVNLERANNNDEGHRSLPSLEQRFADDVDEPRNSERASSDLDQRGRDLVADTHPLGMIGKLVPQDKTNSEKVMFVSNRMELPFKMKKHPDGSYQLLIDVEKLCPSCSSGICKPVISNVDPPVTEIENDMDASNRRHRINKRYVQKPQVPQEKFYNLHKKRKPLPLEKGKAIKIKRSIDSDTHLKENNKFLGYLLNNVIDSKNSISKNTNTFGKFDDKEDKKNIDVTQQRIELLSNVINWWRSFVEN